MKLDPTVWGPKYWFVLFSIAHTYPANPNAVCKRKYYDFIQNLPLFLPNAEIGAKFASMLAQYPVQPYLDNQDSFMRWVWFIHNKINKALGKRELSLHESLDVYLSEYLPKPVSISRTFHIRTSFIHIAIILSLLFLIYAASGTRHTSRK